MTESIGNQQQYADMDRTKDFDIFHSTVPRQTETHSDGNDQNSDDETPVERNSHFNIPDRRLAIRDDRPLNRLPNRLPQTPQPTVTKDDKTMYL